MSDISRGDVLYKRAQGFAKAAFIVAGIMVLAAVASLVSESVLPDWFDKVPSYMAGGRENVSPLLVVASVVRTWVESAFLIAGCAFLVLTAARVAAADSRPSWAPLIDEKFARRAEIFALIAFGYAGLDLIVSVINVVHAGIAIFGRSTAYGGIEWQVLDIVRMMIPRAFWLFFIVAGALVIQSLVAIATSDYAGRVEERRDE